VAATDPAGSRARRREAAPCTFSAPASKKNGILMAGGKFAIALVAAGVLGATVCSSSSLSANTNPRAPSRSDLPAAITAIMDKPRYADATWSLLVTDVASGKSFYALNANRRSLTGSTRKLFSTGLALRALGADARQTTPVYRTGTVDAQGTLDGDLVLVAGGDLTFGGRRIDADTVDVTDFDHNDANSLGSAILTPEDPLYALDQLAADVKASGITSVGGDVAIDDRLFTPYRVPNGDLLITPMLVNENQVDVSVTPTEPGQPATVEYRPHTGAFTVDGSVTTTAAGTDAAVSFSDDNLIACIGTAGCTGTVSGTIPQGYAAPLTSNPSFVGTFRVEDPAAYARTAFIDALRRHGVAVTAAAVGPNPASVLPARGTYPTGNRVATYRSPPFSENVKLVLKVSLNLGANLDLSLFGLTKGQKTVKGALAAERRTLIDQFGISGNQFEFPTNGSGTPDSEASPKALVQLLTKMSKSRVAGAFQNALPVMGVNGSLATSGTNLPGKGHVFAKPGTTITPSSDGDETLQLKAQNLAGYIETKSGRKVAYALMVNDAGTVNNLAEDVGGVFADEATISSIIYESL
jgi:PBP4 family serine-type D-alanyl-D-alanine carboxypeptidase